MLARVGGLDVAQADRPAGAKGREEADHCGGFRSKAEAELEALRPTLCAA